MVADQQGSAAGAEVMNLVGLEALGAEAAFQMANIGHRSQHSIIGTMKRRTFIQQSAMAGMMAGAIRADTAPTVETTAGKIRGFAKDKVYGFRGVPYGASTAGAGRFMPAAKPKPWAGVKDCIQFGGRSPQVMPGIEPPEVLATDPKEPLSEDCLVLNVWSQGLGTGKRPVMVWLHGGGFVGGSASFSIYDGTNLARKQDAGGVGVNHRLNAFGYLYLAELGGAKYAQSSNIGQMDIVAALEWVRDNIAKFGGDPGNVTIFGQSGGGAKVSTLLAMPSAKGLFHRAIVQSGAAFETQPSRRTAEHADGQSDCGAAWAGGGSVRSGCRWQNAAYESFRSD